MQSAELLGALVARYVRCFADMQPPPRHTATMQRKARSDGGDAFLVDTQRRGHHSQSRVALAETRAEAFVSAINAASDDEDPETTDELSAASLFVHQGADDYALAFDGDERAPAPQPTTPPTQPRRVPSRPPRPRPRV